MSVKNMCTMCTVCTQHSGFAQVTSPFHLRYKSVSPPLQVRCKSVLNPFPMFGDILDASPGGYVLLLALLRLELFGTHGTHSTHIFYRHPIGVKERERIT